MRPAEGAARLVCLLLLAAVAAGHAGVQPLARIAIHRARFALDASAAVRASPELLGTKVRSYTCLSAALNNHAFDSFFRPPNIAICVLGTVHALFFHVPSVVGLLEKKAFCLHCVVKNESVRRMTKSTDKLAR